LEEADRKLNQQKQLIELDRNEIKDNNLLLQEKIKEYESTHSLYVLC
jgi:hypothetical protein